MFGRKGVKRIEEVEADQLSDEVAQGSEGFSLEELGRAYSVALQESKLDSTKSAELVESFRRAPQDEFANDLLVEERLLDAPVVEETDGIALRPESILEAVLFLGTSNNQAIGVSKLLELFRNLSADEIDQCIDDLNQSYRQSERAFEIVKEGNGYRFQLAADLNLVRDRFYGKQKETQLNQAAIDCLSLVAYQPGITREQIDQQWNQPAGNMLALLIRKGLIRLERSKSSTAAKTKYFTTDRFLEIIGLGSLEDLPFAEDI
jgi:segregation and condensation protein B